MKADVGAGRALARRVQLEDGERARPAVSPATVLAGADQRLGTLSGARSERMTAASAETLSRTPGSSHNRRMAFRLRTRLCTATAGRMHAGRVVANCLAKEPACDRPTAPVTAHQSERSGFMFRGAASSTHAACHVLPPAV